MAFMMNPPGFFEGDMKKSLKQIHSWLYQLNEHLRYTFSHLDSENFTAEFVNSLGAAGGGGESISLDDIYARLDALEAGGGGGESEAAEWQTLTLRNLNASDEARLPSAICRNGIVFLSGGGYPLSTFSSNGTLTLGQLPAAYRPGGIRQMPIISERGHLQLEVSATGTVKIKNLTGYSIATTYFISLCCSYSL